MSNRTQQAVLIIILLLCGAYLALHIYLGGYTRLMADDFCSINDARRYSILGHLKYWYLNWGGRYSVSLMDSLTFRAFDEGVVRFAPSAALVTWLLATCFTSFQLLRKEGEDSWRLLAPFTLGIAVLFTIISLSPGVTKTLYWWNGMHTYIPALIIQTFHLGFLILWIRKRVGWKSLLPGVLASFLLAFASGGFNESFTVFQVLLYAGILGGGLVFKKLRLTDQLTYLICSALLASLISLTIMLIAPGTTARQALYPDPPGMLTLVSLSLVVFVEYLTFVFQPLEKTLAWIGLFLVSAWIGVHSVNPKPSGWIVLVSFAAGLTLAIVSLLPSVYATSRMPALRTLIIPTTILVFSLAYAGLATGKSVEFASHSGRQSILLIVAVLTLSTSAWLNTRSLYSSRSDYIDFATRWDEVDSMIRQAKANGEESMTIPAMDNWARLDRPNENPKFWATACYSDFYGIQIYGPPYE